MNKLLIIFILFTSSIFSQTNPMEFYTNGNSLFYSGNYKEAIENYTKLIEATDEFLVIKTGFINRGLAYDKMKEYDKAISDFTKAIKLDSIDMASYIDRGLSRLHAGYLDDAKADFQYVVIQNTNKKMKENALYWLIKINYETSQFQNVIANCNVYLRSNSNDSEIYFYRASAHSILREFKKSISDYSKIIEMHPNEYKAIANRGIAKINLLTGNGNIQPSLKDTKSACKDLKKAKELGDNTVEDMIFVFCKKRKKKN